MSDQEFRPSRFQILPAVVKNLLIINGIMFLLTMVLQDKFEYDLNDLLGLHYPGSSAFYPFQYITYMFMHGSFTHILFNMLALWMFGNALENIWGPKRFLIFYFVCGIGAAAINSLVNWYDIEQTRLSIANFTGFGTPEAFDFFLHKQNLLTDGNNVVHTIMNYIFDRKSPQELVNFVDQWKHSPKDPGALHEATSFCNEYLAAKINSVTVGASGAIFGILLAFGMFFPDTIIYLYFAIPIKAKYFVWLYGGLELFLGVQQNAADNVAHFAHLGGMLFGYILILIWKRTARSY